MRRYALLLAALLSLASTRATRGDDHANGQWLYTHQVVDGDKVIQPWRELVSEKVVAEGLAWGAFAKGIGPHLLLSDAQIYFKDLDAVKHDLNGRLLRIEGILRHQHVPAVSTFSQGTGRAYDYYYIEVQKWQAIDRVAHPWLRDASLLQK